MGTADTDPEEGGRPTAPPEILADTLGVAPPPPPSTGAGGEADPEDEPALEGLDLPTRFRRGVPGGRPGIDHADLAELPSGPGEVLITCIDYGPDRVEAAEVEDLDAFLVAHRAPWCAVRWINVDGLSDMRVIHALATKYGLHPLAIEDLLRTTQRPKVDVYSEDGDLRARVSVIIRMIQLVENRLHHEQISIFLGHRTVLTFQETRGDVWDPIRTRLKAKGSRIRANDASFLVYSLIDAVVDHCFPILERYGDRLESLEDMVLEQASPESIHEIHGIKRELTLLRRALWPMRDVVQTLQHDTTDLVGATTRTYLRDVQDHVVQVLDILETYRELCTDLAETYVGRLSLRMNETIRVLTVLATIFTPITFLASVYGMNFHHFPELDQRWAYPAFWALCISIAGAMFWWFRRRHWL